MIDKAVLRRIPFWLVIALFALLLPRLFYFTFTQDSITWLYVNSRAVEEGLSLRHYWPQCESQARIAIPWLLVPGRLFAWLFHPDNFFQARLVSGFIFLAMIGAMAWVVKLTDRHASLVVILALILGWMSYGTLPFYMIALRPETLLMLGLLLFMLFAHYAPRVQTKADRMALGILYLLLCSWFFSIHMKAVLFVPLVLLCGHAIVKRYRAKTALALLVLFMAWQSHGMWQEYIGCRDENRVVNLHRNWAIPVDTIVKHPGYTARRVAVHLGNFMDQYVIPHAPKNLYKDYQPMLVWSIHALFAGWALAAVAVLIHVRRWWPDMGLRRAAIWCACILPSAASVVALKYGGRLYEGPLVLSVVVFSMMVVWACMGRVAWLARVRPWLAGLVIAVAIFSLSLTLFTLRYENVHASRTDYGVALTWLAYVPQYENMEDTRPHIAHVAKRCDIALDGSSRRVLFDASTYLALRHTRDPVHAEGFAILGPKGVPLMHRLREMGSDGVVLSCKNAMRLWLPVISENEVCCMSRQMLESAP